MKSRSKLSVHVLATLAILPVIFGPLILSDSSVLAEIGIVTVTVGNNPRDLVVDPGSGRIYVADAGSNNVWVIDGDTSAVVSAIAVSSETYGYDVNPPFGMDLNPVTGLIYVAVKNSDIVSVIDINSNSVVDTIPANGGPIAVTVNELTDYVYVIGDFSDSVLVIDGKSRATVREIKVGYGALGIAVNSATNRIYVANNNTDSVSVIDGRRSVVVANVPVGNGAIDVVVNSLTNRVYITNNDSNSVSVLDGKSDEVVATIPVGASPVGAIVDPATDFIFVANSDDGTVSIIDGVSDKVVAVVPFGGSLEVAVNSNSSKLFVADGVDFDSLSIEDALISVLPPVMPRTGDSLFRVLGLIGGVLAVLGVMARCLGTSKRLLGIGVCLVVAALGTPLVIATGPAESVNSPTPQGKRIALTFDDGYNSRNTNLILDILEREKIRATFFPVTSWVQVDPTTYRRIAASHEVGNHTYSHPFLTRLPDESARSEIARGVQPPLLRPPYGDINSRVREIARTLGFQVIMWDIDSRDWTGISPAQVTANVVKNAGDGKIALMHMQHWNTTEALPTIIAQLRARGFSFVTVPEIVGKEKSP